MAYDGTIPALSNLISNDIPAMQENFSLLESAQVVDEGSTEDGDYIRWENGWQICVNYFIFNDEVTGAQIKNLPISFVSIDDVYQLFLINTESSEDGENSVITGHSFDENIYNEFRFRAWVPQLTTDESFKVFAFAIGRWK